MKINSLSYCIYQKIIERIEPQKIEEKKRKKLTICQNMPKNKKKLRPLPLS